MYLSTEVDVRMRRIPSIDLVSTSQGLTYQRIFEAIKEMQATQQRKWPGQDVSNALKVVRAVMKKVTRGLARTVPCGRTRGSICGWTRGIRPPY